MSAGGITPRKASPNSHGPLSEINSAMINPRKKESSRIAHTKFRRKSCVTKTMRLDAWDPVITDHAAQQSWWRRGVEGELE